jgi:hypothetical protein
LVDVGDVLDEVHLVEGKTEVDICFETMGSAIWAGRVGVERIDVKSMVVGKVV